MKLVPLATFVIFQFVFVSCTYNNEISDPAAASRPVPAVPPRPMEKIDHELERAIADIAQAAKGKVGVGAVLVETGDAAYLDRRGHFAMQSVYKLPIAMAVGQKIDNGTLNFDSDVVITPADYVRRGYHSPIRNLNPRGTVMRLDDIIRYSLSESDGSANDVLLNIAGGPPSVQQYLSSIGITDMIVADSTKEISRDWETQYRNWASPEASVDLLRALLQRRGGLSEKSTTLIFDSMLESGTGRHRIRRGLPDGATLAHKTGTGGHPSEVPGYRPPANSNGLNKTVATRTNAKPSRASRSDQGSKGIQPKRSSAGRDAESEDSDKTNEVTSATNDIGIITLPDGRHIILAVYIQDSVADGRTREKVIADIAQLVCERWTTGQLLPTSQGAL
jgi:beta-lactamase class A